MSPTVRVVCLSTTPGPVSDTRPRLRAAAYDVLVEAVGATELRRLCPRCASSQHGRPRALVADGPPPHVSLSYSGEVGLLAWTWDGPVGVDLEHTGPDAGVYGDLATWTRAEAILKATGEGLRRDPSDLPTTWSTPLVDLPSGLVGHVALVGVSNAEVRLEMSGR